MPDLPTYNHHVGELSPKAQHVGGDLALHAADVAFNAIYSAENLADADDRQRIISAWFKAGLKIVPVDAP